MHWIAHENYQGFGVTQGFKTRAEAEARLAHVLAYSTERLLRMELRHGESVAHSWLHLVWEHGKGVTFERRGKACTPARLKAISDRARQRLMKIERRFRFSRREFQEIDAFIARHRQFAERAWLAFVIAEGVIVKRQIDAFEASQLYGV